MDNPLLFLHNLKEVKWKDNESEGKYSQKTKEEYNIFGVKCKYLLLENSSENKRDRLWMFSEEIEIDERRFPVYVGFYIKNAKLIQETGRIYTVSFPPRNNWMCALLCMRHLF